MAATGGDTVAAGLIVEQRMAEWAGEAAQPISRSIAELRPDAAVASLTENIMIGPNGRITLMDFGIALRQASGRLTFRISATRVER